MRMSSYLSGRLVVRLLVLFLCLAATSWAQFTANIQGTVTDPSAAGVGQAKVAVENLSIDVTAETTTDADGSYRFLSLAPGPYKISVKATGFSKSETGFTLETNQNLNLPIALKVGAATESVVVTSEVPLLNVADTRNQRSEERRVGKEGR